MVTEVHGDDEVLVDYVSRALELRERGEEPQLEDLCRAHPELVGRVAAMLRRAPSLAGMASSAQEFDGLQGRVLAGRYRLDARLGAGAMGIVYRAFDTQLSRAVAVKVLRPELFGGLDAEKRFLREAEVLAALRHPNVVAVHDRGTTEDAISFLVMELLQGQPLVALLAEHEKRVERSSAALDEVAFAGPLLGGACELEGSWLRQAVRWTAELAGGLVEAHRLGILHRDVKPSNVFVGSDGRARLLDFGVAASANHATLTAAGHGALGTPGYMAPEVITEQAPATAAADVYGLGATLYHLLTRRPPYVGTATHIIASVQRRDPMAVGRLRAGLPRDLHAIVDRAMARRVNERYATMAEFERDLRAFLHHQPVQARPLSVWDRTWRKVRRSPSARVAAVIGGGVVATWMAYEGWRHLDSRRETRYLDAVAEMPPGLNVEQAQFRAIADPVERAALRRLLDAAVANAASPIPSRVQRAAFLLDQGDTAAAARDMQELAGAVPSALTAELAERYVSAAANGGVGYAAINLEGLPTPASLQDRYLIAYHQLRRGPTTAWATQVIEWFEGTDPTFLCGQEMLVNAYNLQADELMTKDPEAAMARFSAALEVCVRVEARRGRRTAVTAQQTGSILLGQQRFAEAVRVLEEGARLSPWSNGLLRNLARAQRRVGELDQAIATCDRGIALRPGFLDHYQTKARVFVDQGRYDAARSVVAAAPQGETPQAKRAYGRVLALTEFSITLAHVATGTDPIRCATAALAYFDAIGEEQRVERRLCEAIVTGDRRKLVRTLLELWAEEPWSPTIAESLASIVSLLDEEEVELLRAGLRKLARQQASSRPLQVRPDHSPQQKTPTEDVNR